MTRFTTDFWVSLLEQGLKDDGQPWDFTALGTLKSPEQVVDATLKAKSAGIFAAQNLLLALGRVSSVNVQSKFKNGQTFKKGEVLASFKGPAREILAFERPVINLAAYACGIATQTNAAVSAVTKAWKKLGAKTTAGLLQPRVTSTRKIMPHYRELSFESVLAGGGHLHRTDLQSGILIKENHIAASGSIARAIGGTKAIAPHTLKIEIEVQTNEQLLEAVRAGADIVMLDNYSPVQVKKALKLLEAQNLAGRALIEISGGLNAENVAPYVLPGIAVLSMGGITHSVKSSDLSLLVNLK